MDKHNEALNVVEIEPQRSKNVPEVTNPGWSGIRKENLLASAVSSSVTRLSSLKESKLTIHEGVRYHCDQCEYKSSTPDSLKIHKQGVHDNDKYSCDQCQYRGKNNGHVETHNESVPSASASRWWEI